MSMRTEKTMAYRKNRDEAFRKLDEGITHPEVSGNTIFIPKYQVAFRDSIYAIMGKPNKIHLIDDIIKIDGYKQMVAFQRNVEWNQNHSFNIESHIDHKQCVELREYLGIADSSNYNLKYWCRVISRVNNTTRRKKSPTNNSYVVNNFVNERTIEPFVSLDKSNKITFRIKDTETVIKNDSNDIKCLNNNQDFEKILKNKISGTKIMGIY